MKRNIYKIIVFAFILVGTFVVRLNPTQALVSGTLVCTTETIKIGETVAITVNWSVPKPSTLKFTAGAANGAIIAAPSVSVTEMGDNGVGVTKGSFKINVTGKEPGSSKIVVLSSDSIQIDPIDEINFSSNCTINVVKPEEPKLSSNSNLSSLTVSTGTLQPKFASGTLSYTATLPTGTKSVTIGGSKEDSKATVSGFGSITVSNGSKHTITVTAEDKTKKSYVLTFAIPTPEPVESPKEPPVETVVEPVKPTQPTLKTRTETRTVAIEYEVVYQNDATLNSGVQKVIQKGVNGSEVVTYEVTYDPNNSRTPEEWVEKNRVTTKEPIDQIVARGTKSVSTNLKSLYVDGADISPGFKPTTTSYTFTLKEPATSVNIRAEAENSEAKVTGTGQITITQPNHSQTVTVTLAGKSTNYKITIVQPERIQEEVKISYKGQDYKVITIETPIEGFEAKSLSIGTQTVQVISNNHRVNIVNLENLGMVLVNDQGEIYSRYNPVQVNGEAFFAIEIPEEGQDLEGLVYSEFKLGNYTIYGYKYADPSKNQFNIFYLQNQQGEINEYLYNTMDQSLILLKEAQFETPAETSVETLVETPIETETNEEINNTKLDVQQLMVYAGLIVVGILLIVLLLLIIKRMKEARR